MHCNLVSSDCDVILKNYLEDNKAKSVGFKVFPVSNNMAGYLGKHLLLEIRYNRNETFTLEKARFFLKSTTDVDNPYVHFFPNVYHKESGMYDIMQKYNAQFGDLFRLDIAPKIYLNHVKSETIVMENLSLRGYRMYDPQKKIVDVPHMLAALECLAKFHAASIIYEEEKSSLLGRRFEVPEEFGHYLEEIAFSRQNEKSFQYSISGLKGMCTLTDLLEPDIRISANEFKKQIMLAADKMFNLMEDSETYRCVWSHGDLWARNLMFSLDEENKPIDCKFVDFQFVRYAPPALDVTILIYHTLDLQTINENYNGFLNHYYIHLTAVLQKAGVKADNIYTREYFFKSCKDYLICSKIMLGIYRTLTAATEDTYRNLCTDLRLFEHVLIEDRSEYAKQNFLSDANYTKQLTEIMEVVKSMVLEELVAKIEEA